MALPGRKPKPTALKVLTGNPGKRPLNPGVKAPPVAPKCPAWLSPDAKREWRRVVPDLERSGLVAERDRVALEGYCESYATWKRSMLVIREKGATFETPNGYVAVRPEVAIAHKSLADVRAFCAEFGLTPSSRGRMTLPEVDDGADKWDGLLD